VPSQLLLPSKQESFERVKKGFRDVQGVERPRGIKMLCKARERCLKGLCDAIHFFGTAHCFPPNLLFPFQDYSQGLLAFIFEVEIAVLLFEPAAR